jgi:hypothetical protein
VGRFPLSVKLAAYGESLALERRLKLVEEGEDWGGGGACQPDICVGGWKEWESARLRCADVGDDGGNDEVCEPFALGDPVAAKAIVVFSIFIIYYILFFLNRGVLAASSWHSRANLPCTS